MKTLSFILSFTALLLTGCVQNSNLPQTILKTEYQSYFDDYGLEGSFILFDLAKNTYTYVNPEQKDKEYIPASTFKLCNSLIGLETGVIEDEHFVIPWDSIDRGYSSWNQDQTLASALKYSAVWYYQELARRVGEKQMQEWIDKAEYGNRNLSGGIDQFWLRGGLKITPAQQVEFLKKLYLNTLPFAAEHQETVKKIMIVEETDAYTLHAKTGWAFKNSVGWYVGYVERGGDVYFFSTCVQGDDFDTENFGKARMEISRKILQELGII